MQEIDFNKLGQKFSPSEQRGINLIKNTDLLVFCPGISTCGFAEIKMALQNKKRQIIATTIDTEGFKETKNIIKKLGLNDRILVKKEDVTKPMPYNDNYFNFIYARLILHYLTKQELNRTLKEFYRVLKPDGRMFIVVRKKDWEANTQNSKYDSNTKMVTYTLINPDGTSTSKKISRYFHTKDSISKHLKAASFNIEYIREHKEQLFHDYMRTVPTPKMSSIIELLAKK